MNRKANAVVRGQRLRRKLSFRKDRKHDSCIHQRELACYANSTERLSKQSSSILGQTGFAFIFEDFLLSFLNQQRKVRADAIGNAERKFQRWIAKSTLNKTQHGLGNTRTLRNDIIGQFPAFPLLSQEPDDLVANGFVVADSRHAEAWQEKGVDIYFAIVKLRLVGKRNSGKREENFRRQQIFRKKKRFQT